MLAALARQLARAAREARFARELSAPQMIEARRMLALALQSRPDVEHGVVMRPDVLPTTFTSGSDMGATVPELAPSGRRATFVHNHLNRESRPDIVRVAGALESPISLQDMQLAGAFPSRRNPSGFGRMAALISDDAQLSDRGSIAVVTGRGRKHLARAAILNELRKLDDEMTDEAVLRRPGRLYPKAEAFNRALHDLGLTRYGSRYSPGTEQAFEAHASLMSDYQQEVARRLHPQVFNLPYPFRWSHIGAGGAGALGAAAGGYAASRRKPDRRRR